MPGTTIFDRYKRGQVVIRKALLNEQVSALMTEYYSQLAGLIKSESDEDAFVDTYLRLTAQYDGSKPFVVAFKQIFASISRCYRREDATAARRSVGYEVTTILTAENEQPRRESTITLKQLRDAILSQDQDQDQEEGE